MPAPKGNSFWKLRSTHGRKPIFETPEKLWDACEQYLEAVENNPLTAAELVKYQGEAKIATVPKMRAMTIAGLCIYLDISQDTWFEYCKRKDYAEVTTRVDQIIRDQKFCGAAAELLNPNIIARDLGLRDKQDHEMTGELLSRVEVAFVGNGSESPVGLGDED